MKTSLDYVSKVESPWLYVGEGELERRAWIPSFFYCPDGAEVCVRKLRGWKMRNVQALMDEFAAAFQFFDEFGENWPALKDTLTSLDEWLPAKAYLILIERAEDVLADDSENNLGGLLATLQRSAVYWSEPIAGQGQFDRPAIPFHTLLLVSDARSAGCERILRSAHREKVPLRND